MRGRAQAVLVAAISTGTVFLAWLGASVMALVTLRKGVRQGFYVLLWSSLPALVAAVWLGDIGPLAVLLVTGLGAWILRYSVSWPLALVVISGAGLAISTLLMLVGQPYLQQLAELLQRVVQEASQGLPANQQPASPGVVAIAGILGLSAAGTSALCLLLARWWQAVLYNPGGFREEFHRLRLTPPATMLTLAIGLALSSAAPEWRLWALTAGLPLTVAGFALVHGLVGQRGRGGGLLFAIYALWLLSDWVKGLLILLAVADSWLDFRSRGRPPANGA